MVITVCSFTGMAARDVAQALRSLASAARGVAANTEDPQACSAILDCARDVLDKSGNLIEETKRAIAKPGDPDSQQRLAQVRCPMHCRCIRSRVLHTSGVGLYLGTKPPFNC